MSLGLESWLQASGLDHRVVRPCGYFSDMGALLKMARRGRAFLVGDGTNRMSPKPSSGRRAEVRRTCDDEAMTMFRSRGIAVLVGAATWTATEYGLHRFVMHEMRGRGLPSVEHLKHHADVTYFSPTSKKLASAAGTTAVAYPVAALVAGRRRATAFTAGLIATYFAYEVLHRRAHTHPPRNRYGRWVRRSHLHHHFGSPMRNFGVTTPVWDRLAGTYDDPGVVTVPRRMAPVWLLDDAGDVRAVFAGDYIVKGARPVDQDQVEQDRADAFANIAPEA